MSKIESLSNILVEKYSISQTDADQFVKEIFNVIKENLLTDNLVKVKGLGTFKLTEVSSRASVDVNTGERINIEGHSKISFTPENAVRDRINAPFSQFESFDIEEGTDFAPIDSKYNAEEEKPETKEVPETASTASASEIADTPVAEISEPSAEQKEPETEIVPAVEEVVEADSSLYQPIAKTVEEDNEVEKAVEEVATAEETVKEEPSIEEPVKEESSVEETSKEEPVVDATPSPSASTEPTEETKSSNELAPEELKNELRRTNTLVKILIFIVVLLALCILAFGVYVYVNHNKSVTPAAEPTEQTENPVQDTTATQNQPAVTQEQTPQTVTAQEPQVEDEPDAKDFEVVGSEEVVLTKSMNYKELSDEYGGDYMRDFIRDANGGKKRFDKGETVIIPKLEKKH